VGAEFVGGGVCAVGLAGGVGGGGLGLGARVGDGLEVPGGGVGALGSGDLLARVLGGLLARPLVAHLELVYASRGGRHAELVCHIRACPVRC
jgi:hypothetical protein